MIGTLEALEKAINDKRLGHSILLEGKNEKLLEDTAHSLASKILESKNLHHVALLAEEFNVYTQTIGRVNNNGRLKINDLIDIDKKSLSRAYFKSFEKIMNDQ